MREVGDGNHNGRRGDSFTLPSFARFIPIVAQDGVSRIYEIGKWNMRFHFTVDVILYFWVSINVVKARFEICCLLGVVADNYARSLDKAGFNGVVEAEVADYPLEKGFFATALAG